MGIGTPLLPFQTAFIFCAIDFYFVAEASPFQPQQFSRNFIVGSFFFYFFLEKYENFNYIFIGLFSPCTKRDCDKNLGPLKPK